MEVTSGRYRYSLKVELMMPSIDNNNYYGFVVSIFEEDETHSNMIRHNFGQVFGKSEDEVVSKLTAKINRWIKMRGILGSIQDVRPSK